MNTLFKCCFLLLLAARLSAGNEPILAAAREDFKKTNAAYSKLTGLSMDTYYAVYSDYQAQNMIEGKNGRYIKFNNLIYTKIDNIETYMMNDKIITINPDNRLIMVGDNKPLQLSPLETDSDSLLAQCSNIELEETNENEKTYKLYFDDTYSEFSRIEISINLRDLRYKKIVMYYNAPVNLKQDFYGDAQQPRLEITYNNCKELNSLPPLFNEALYIVNNQGKLKPAPKYYNFRVSDLRNQTRLSTQKKPK